MSHERNALLLYEIKSVRQSKDFGSISNFFETSPSWRCPCCLRSKPEIARLDRNGNLLCSLVWHHDHFSECVPTSVNAALRSDFDALRALEASVVRFADILICSDCNVAEPSAKAMVGAPKPFSFAPFEIAGFINVTRNEPHTVDKERACLAYQAASQSMALIAQRLREIGSAVHVSDIEEWQHVKSPAIRVLREMKIAGTDAS